MKTPAAVLLLNRASIAASLTLDSCIEAVEAAFAAHARGRSLQPEAMHVDAPGGEFHIKAGGLHCSRTYFACKINGGFFSNHARLDLPNIIGLILLSDAETGAPLVVMESGLVTRLRTGAATAIAAKYLALRDTHTVTICGAGAQAEVQLHSLARVLPIRLAFLWHRRDAGPTARRLSHELGIDVRGTADLAEASGISQAIVTCTPARQWFLGREHVAPGTFVAAVGADSPGKQEIEPALLASASVVCDLAEQCAQVGDLHHALAADLMTREQVRGELGQIIIGEAPRRRDDEEVIVFDSTGTALQDVAVAAAVYEQSLAAGRGETFAFWG